MESTLSIGSFIAQIFTFLASFILPIACAIIISKIYKIRFRFAIFGALGFFVLQLCIRIPLLQTFEVQTFLSFLSPILYTLILAASAAIFETVGRLLVFKIFFRKEHSFGAALLSGIGHGGIEAMSLVGLTYLNNIIISVVLIFTGSMQETVKAFNLPESYIQVLQSFSNLPASSFVMAGLERIFTMIFHIFASLLLFYFIQKKQTIIGMMLTISIHTLLDFSVALLSSFGVSLFFIEFIVFVFALLSAIGILFINKKFKNLNKLGEIENG